MMKISIKREQSQAGLSFAEREKFRPQVKNKLFLLLALLLTAATGAWAQTPLLTIEGIDNEDFTSGSKTFDDKVTVTFSNPVYNDGDEDGWYSAGGASLLTVTGTNGYTITSCKFYTSEGIAANGYTIVGESPSVYLYQGHLYTDDSKSVTLGTYGVAKIEVYGAAASPATGYTVSMKDGVKDADKWTVKVGEGQAQALPIGGLKGDGKETVTLQYNGRLKVKGVKATSEAAAEEPAVTWNTVDLSTLTAGYEAQDGDKLTGTLPGNYKISIADGATVMLDGAVINGTNNESYKWAGLTLAGDGTIILSGENSVKGFYEDYPGISVPANKTLTIQGDGSLTASSNGYGAGIGGGWSIACGNITIEGGTVTATGSNRSAGIGGGRSSSCGNISITGGTVTATGGGMAPGIGGGYSTSCGNISITGGTVTATGGDYAAGIGGGYSTSCGDITIANTVTKVTATKGTSATNSIGVGMGGSCGTVTIGGNVGAITTSPYTYQPTN